MDWLRSLEELSGNCSCGSDVFHSLSICNTQQSVLSTSKKWGAYKIKDSPNDGSSKMSSHQVACRKPPFKSRFLMHLNMTHPRHDLAYTGEKRTN